MGKLIDICADLAINYKTLQNVGCLFGSRGC